MVYRLHLVANGGVLLKIAAITQNVPSRTNNNKKQTPSFGSLGMPILSISGSMMQWIESKGYFMSFLIQDGLGMTLPRAITGFNRDKNITGEYNIQEGLEVFGREAMSGPYMMAVAPATLALAGLVCKSTNTNTRLIKRLGDSLKEMITQPNFDKAIQKDAEKFKNEFYRFNIEKIYKNSVPNDKNANETIEFILKEFKNLESKDKKVQNKAYADISNKINEKIIESSTDLYEVNKLSVGDENSKQIFGIKETIQAIKDYAQDAIIRNANRESIDASAAENIKNNFATKRFAINWLNVGATLGGLSLLPKLYIRSNVSPSAHALEVAQTQQQKQKDEVAFKGRGINNDGIISKIGKFLTKNMPEKVQELFEYAGYNFSSTTFTCLALFGLLLPRGKKAWDRAPVDDKGKKDLTEIHEILLRDTISTFSVVFAVPCLTKMLVSSFENKVGFVLTNKASEGKNVFKKMADILWPYSKLNVLSVADLDAIYGNINSKDKLMNFANFVNKKGGDLEKILSKSENASLMFNESSFTLDSIKKLSKAEKNEKIISLFEKLENKDDIISKVMKGSGDIKNNKILKVARGFNSVPGVISTVLISPIILGVLIPLLTYHNTRKANAKKIEEMNSQA